MSLEEKIMYLYEDILGPETERKIVLVLKYLIIDKETDLNTIKKEIHISNDFIQQNINNDGVMLKYLTENELKKFRFKMDKILEKNVKLIDFIKLVLIKNETNIKTVMNLVPLSIDTVKRYVENKEKMLRYLTEEEYKKILDIATPYIYPKTKLEKLIEAVMVDGKTDLESIEKENYIKRDLVKRCVNNPNELEQKMSKEDIGIFVGKLKKMLEEIELKEYEKDKKYVGQIINDIFDTRHLYEDICAKNLFSVEKFEKYLYDEEYMKKEFPKITAGIIKSKIKENEKIRIRKPYNMCLIEDKFCVMISKKDVYYLSQFDMKKLNVVSYYLGTGANLIATCEHFKMQLLEVFANLSSPKLDQILNEPYSVILKHCLNIENILNKNDLNAKKTFTIEITKFLEENNFDIKLAMEYYKIPEPLFNRILEEIKKLPYASDSTKQNIGDILNIESQAKSK